MTKKNQTPANRRRKAAKTVKSTRIHHVDLGSGKAKEGVVKVIEPNASTISDRMAALKQAHKMGLRTYGMLCPLLPGVSDSYEDILELVGFVKDCGAEQVFAEAVNPRGRGLIETAAGFIWNSGVWHTQLRN